MKNIFKLILSLLIAINLAGCNDKQSRRISAIIPLAESRPDSALTLLNKIDQAQLSEKAITLYSMAYTIAQDKTGIDVDNDSLLRNAYNWYNGKPADSLYAKCEYYMGKYYALNDSSEKALRCFSNSVKAAKRQNDYYTQSLALLQSSVILRSYNQNLAISYALSADAIYNKLKNASVSNKVHMLLNIAECFSYKDSEISKSTYYARKAIEVAEAANDSNTIADAYQDLSVFYEMADNDSALWAADRAFLYRDKKDASTFYALSMAYYQADSLNQAQSLLYQIPQASRARHEYEIFSLLKQIAWRKNDIIKVSEYADSSAFYLEKENTEVLRAKDQYYAMMTKREVQSTQYRSESKWKTILNIICISFSIIIITCLFYVYIQKKKKALEKAENERMKYAIEMRNKEIQIKTMRDFLLRKVDIVNKLESLKTNSREKIVLSDEDWEEIEIFLNNADGNFTIRLHQTFPDLATKDVHLLMLLRLGISNASMAAIYNIEEKSIRQNLFLVKKKIGIDGKNMSTRKFIEEF